MTPHHTTLLGATIISVIVLTGFGLTAGLLFYRELPEGSREAGLVVLGGLTQMAGTVVGYWLGSSVGSSQKNAMLTKDGQ